MITASAPMAAPIIMGIRLEPDDDDPEIADSFACIAMNYRRNLMSTCQILHSYGIDYRHTPGLETHIWYEKKMFLNPCKFCHRKVLLLY